MRFTRSIPGIHLPLPGRPDRAAPGVELFAVGWMAALVWILLNGVLGVWYFCTFRFGGEAAEIWLTERTVGLSLLEIASACNLALAALLALAFVAPARRLRRGDWKRIAGIVLALVVLGVTQALLNGWGRLARLDRDSSQVWSDERPGARDAALPRLSPPDEPA